MATPTITHQLVLKVTGNGQPSVNGPTVSGTDEQVKLPTITAGATNVQVGLAFTIANLKSIVITTTQAVTLKTNSTSSPGNTFSLTPSGLFSWQAGSGETCPFTADVTTLYFANSGANDAYVTIRCLLP